MASTPQNTSSQPVTAALWLIRRAPRPPECLKAEALHKNLEALRGNTFPALLANCLPKGFFRSGKNKLVLDFAPKQVAPGKVLPEHLRDHFTLEFAAGDERGQAFFLIVCAARLSEGLCGIVSAELRRTPQRCTAQYLVDLNRYASSLWWACVQLLAKRGNAREIRIRSWCEWMRLSHENIAALRHFHPELTQFFPPSPKLYSDEVRVQYLLLFAECLAISDDPRFRNDYKEVEKVAELLYRARVLGDAEFVERLWKERMRFVYIRYWAEAKNRMREIWQTMFRWANKETWGLGTNAWGRFQNIEGLAYNHYLKCLAQLKLIRPEQNQSVFAYFGGKANRFFSNLKCEAYKKIGESAKEVVSEGEITTKGGSKIDKASLGELANPEDYWARPYYDDLLAQLYEIAGKRPDGRRALALVAEIDANSDASPKQLAEKLGMKEGEVRELKAEIGKELEKQGLFGSRAVPRPSFFIRFSNIFPGYKKTVVKRTVRFERTWRTPPSCRKFEVPSHANAQAVLYWLKLADCLARFSPDPMPYRAVLDFPGLESDRVARKSANWKWDGKGDYILVADSKKLARASGQERKNTDREVSRRVQYFIQDGLLLDEEGRVTEDEIEGVVVAYEVEQDVAIDEVAQCCKEEAEKDRAKPRGGTITEKGERELREQISRAHRQAYDELKRRRPVAYPLPEGTASFRVPPGPETAALHYDDWLYRKQKPRDKNEGWIKNICRSDLLKLPKGQRDVLIRFYRRRPALTHKEIAEELGISAGSSRVLLARAKRSLKALTKRATVKDIDAEGVRVIERAIEHLNEYLDPVWDTPAIAFLSSHLAFPEAQERLAKKGLRRGPIRLLGVWRPLAGLPPSCRLVQESIGRSAPKKFSLREPWAAIYSAVNRKPLLPFSALTETARTNDVRVAGYGLDGPAAERRKRWEDRGRLFANETKTFWERRSAGQWEWHKATTVRRSPGGIRPVLNLRFGSGNGYEKMTEVGSWVSVASEEIARAISSAPILWNPKRPWNGLPQVLTLRATEASRAYDKLNETSGEWVPVTKEGIMQAMEAGQGIAWQAQG